MFWRQGYHGLAVLCISLLGSAISIGCDGAYRYRLIGMLYHADKTPLANVPLAARIDISAADKSELEPETWTDANGRFDFIVKSMWLYGGIMFPPPPKIDIVYLYIGKPRWREISIEVRKLRQQPISHTTSAVQLPPTKVKDSCRE